MNFISDTTFQPSKSWYFTYHMCAYLVQITVVKFDALPSNDVNYFKILYVIVIMLRGKLQALLIKYNQNNMVEIYPFIYRVLHWSISVHYQRKISIQLHHNINFMQCFIISNLVISNRMHPILLHTASVWFHCSKTKSIDYIVDYNMEKHWYLCWTKHMYLCTVPYVSYVSVLLHHNWSRYKCTWAWKRSRIWTQWCW